jgi:predicted enzyme related to lactoylglutathione lyase
VVVTETFFSVDVADMPRATAFYVGALGAVVVFASPGLAPGVVLADVTDTEGNGFALTQR